MESENKKPKNPNAFPINETDYNMYGNELPKWTGLTIRDYFAAKAITAMCNDLWNFERKPIDYETIAKSAYRLADALLKQRENEN